MATETCCLIDWFQDHVQAVHMVRKQDCGDEAFVLNVYRSAASVLASSTAQCHWLLGHWQLSHKVISCCANGLSTKKGRGQKNEVQRVQGYSILS